MSADKSLTFIVSGGRTGTEFFGHYLSEVIEDCFSVHEPDLFVGCNRLTYARIRQFGWWHMVFGRLIGRTGLRTVGMQYLMRRISDEECRQRIAALRRRYHSSLRQQLIVESNAQWWYVVDQIPRVWPQARVIALIRDPRTWVRSWLNKGDRYVWRDRASLVPPGRLTPKKLGDRSWAARWHEFGAFGKLAWEWRTVYGMLDEFVGRGGNGRIYRFEDVFADDPSTMQNLVRFAAGSGAANRAVGNLADFRESKRNASAGTAGDWPTWRPESARLLDEICGSLMRSYAYGQEPGWQQLLSG